ncbi:hypothetical protein SERLA73DRAFT_71557 [Serpula lacrymans var. lacrymans S7.3]|uniref:DUF6533 domain-containing protein n=1 Tax=Serpula lacrymans var. lacrymans (strain S7.3) TaxID=936435 RepID=F8PTK9_SERL3|nr:hypothetical protein SERLA73DRAFT_71557 [Serpula lacrymans var. lacrymans S7.3]
MSSFSASPASSLAFQLQSVKYVYVACLPVLLLEYFNTFEEEVQLIWKSRWSPVKFLFLFSRYNMFVATIPILILTLGSDIPSNTCKKINLASAVFGVTSVAIAEALSVANVVAFATFPPGLKPMLDIVYYTMHSVLSCRIILHLRAANSNAARTLNPPSQSLQFTHTIHQCHRNESFGCESRANAIPIV